MPSYDYECSTCGHRFEVFQSITDDPLSSCPQCGKSVRRLIGGGAGIIFKGSGFYVNDSRKSGSKAAAASGDSKPSAPAGDKPAAENATGDKSASDKASKDKVAV